MEDRVEPWLRGTLTDVDAVRRQVLHALELAGEDAERWCSGLSNDEMNRRPFGLAPVAFHLRHIARSLDRLLTYAEGGQLDETQLTALATELDPGATSTAMLVEFFDGLVKAEERIRRIDPATYEAARGVGRKQLPTTVGGLLVHCAEHTQRHIGQAITTTRIVLGADSAV
jgi:hypothetical protein